MVAESHRTGLNLLLIGGLCLFVLATLAYGAWYGFPVQDDTYMIRLLRLGGPERIIEEHPDRPAYGLLLAACTRLAGEHRAAYVAIGLIGWSLFAAQSIRLWIRLFPQWASAGPLIGLGVVSPVVQRVQFSTVTTLIPCVLPVMLVLGALLLLLRSEQRPRPLFAIVALLLAVAAALFSEYGLAAAGGAAVLLLLLGRWRSAVPLLVGAPIGYAVFHATAQLSIRRETNPLLQVEGFFSHPWTRPFRVFSAAWNSVIGAWGRGASDVNVDWSSKSTLLAAGAAMGIGAIVAACWKPPADEEPTTGSARKLLALCGAVFVALFPAISIMGWPLRVFFETRFFLPALPFAMCATVGVFLLIARRRWAVAGLFVLAFVAADRLVLQAVEERRLQGQLEEVGRRLQAYVGDGQGLVVLVARDRDGQADLEAAAKATDRWSPPQAARLLIVRPEEALLRFGPRSGCRTAESLRLRPERLRWPRAKEPVRLVLWDAGDWKDFDPEPYFRGCPSLEAHAGS